MSAANIRIAIDYIKSTQAQERQMMIEINRLGDASERARKVDLDNENLRTEIAVMQERLRLVEPGNPHVYGAYTVQLSQNNAQAQANGQSQGYPLPSINAGPPPSQSYTGSGRASGGSQGMQGVEYGNRI
jgi:hypothetical protein